jgi:hypothetical protein
MLNPKTHFEQVPLEAVREMMEEQARQETVAVQAQTAQKIVLEDVLSETQELRRASFRATSHVEQ